MVLENYYIKSMSHKSDKELQDYIDNKDDFKEEAVLAAILELEKRGIKNDNLSVIKAELKSFESENIVASKTIENKTIELYSFYFILLFGILFSVFAGSILIYLNLIQLKNIARSKMAVLAGLSYSFLQVYLIDTFKITSPFISVFSSLLGIYLLYNYFIKSELKPDVEYKARSNWQPLLIGFLISLPIAYFVMKSMGTAE